MPTPLLRRHAVLPETLHADSHACAETAQACHPPPWMLTRPPAACDACVYGRAACKRPCWNLRLVLSRLGRAVLSALQGREGSMNSPTWPGTSAWRSTRRFTARRRPGLRRRGWRSPPDFLHVQALPAVYARARGRWTPAEADGSAAASSRSAPRPPGAVLVQFPWSFKADDAASSTSTRSAATSAGLPLVVEVRHVSWTEPSGRPVPEGRGLGSATSTSRRRGPACRRCRWLRRRSVRAAARPEPQGLVRQGRRPRCPLRLPVPRGRTQEWIARIREISAPPSDVCLHEQPLSRPGPGQRPADSLELQARRVPVPPTLLETYPVLAPSPSEDLPPGEQGTPSGV